jgi:hypothetical protein
MPSKPYNKSFVLAAFSPELAEESDVDEGSARPPH